MLKMYHSRLLSFKHKAGMPFLLTSSKYAQLSFCWYSRCLTTDSGLKGSKLYSIVDTKDSGKIMIAAKDIPPGQQVLMENKPLLCISADELCGIDPLKINEQNALTLLVYLNFKKLDAKVQAQYLDLRGPSEGQQFLGGIKNIANILKPNDFGLVGAVIKKFDKDEKDLFVKVNSIQQYNYFITPQYPLIVYKDIARMPHSCSPNCVWHHNTENQLECSVSTILPVKKGEELTMEYDSAFRTEPTHIRRQNYLLTKGFTCHCPRCNALGDETRRFNCFDPLCTGNHLVHQPINKEPLKVPDVDVIITDLHYDVEYVEPHLLPCTVCSRAPPLGYQQEMLALEKTLPDIEKYLKERVNNQMGDKHKNQTEEECHAALQTLKGIKYPPQHSLSAHNILNSLILIDKFPSVSAEALQHALTLAKQLVASLDSMLQFPNNYSASILHYVALFTNFIVRHPADSAAAAPYVQELIQLSQECSEKEKKMMELLTGQSRLF